jgi:hypothetical protein
MDGTDQSLSIILHFLPHNRGQLLAPLVEDEEKLIEA